MEHRIEETQLVTRKSARDQIHLAWNYQCAYCGEALGRSPTLDHVVPKALGGIHHRTNLVSCCLGCNSSKSKTNWVDWYRAQPFWSATREWAIVNWLGQELLAKAEDCGADKPIGHG